MAFVDVYLALGSNLGDREENLRQALLRLDEAFGTHFKAVSRWMESPSWGFEGRFCDLGERPPDEFPLGDAGVWNRKALRINRFLSIKKDIDIDGAVVIDAFSFCIGFALDRPAERTLHRLALVQDPGRMFFGSSQAREPVDIRTLYRCTAYLTM